MNLNALRHAAWIPFIAFLCVSAPIATAHHAVSAYDRSSTVTVTGTVTRWQFINPHAGLWIAMTGADGETVEWSGEFQGTLDLYRHFQWNQNTFSVGDEVTLIGNPARSGDRNMAVERVIFADGTEVNVRNAPD